MQEAKSKVEKWFKDWKKEIHEYKYLIILSILLIVAAEVATFYTSTYVDRIHTVSVPDLILDNTPIYHLDFIYAYGFIFMFMSIIIYTTIFRVKQFHEVGLLFCLLILVRSIFITLTHLGAPIGADEVTRGPDAFLSLNFRNDLFFSGHAALPFMAFLIFRKEWIGKLFLVLTVILSATVLLMHVHYSIDVFSAFFITYGVYHFGEWLISKEFWHKARVIKHSR